MIYISHRLEELPAIADRVTVLRDGAHHRHARRWPDVSRQQLIQLMVGRELSAVFPKREVARATWCSSCAGSACRSVGVSGRQPRACGRARSSASPVSWARAAPSSPARSSGSTPADAGEILLRGRPRPHRLARPRRIAAGIAYLPEDRRRHGVILEMPIDANITLASLDRLSRASGLDFAPGARARRSTTCGGSASRRRRIYAPVATLSGGNQQKVALSRWLVTKPSVLILDEPTQGIDVGAKAEIHALMVDLAEQGVGDPDDLVRAARDSRDERPHRASCAAGTIAGVLDRAEATPEANPRARARRAPTTRTTRRG